MEINKFIECFNDTFLMVYCDTTKEMVYPDFNSNIGQQIITMYSTLEKKDDSTYFNPYTKQVYELNERHIKIEDKEYTIKRLSDITKYRDLVNEYVLDETTGLYLRKKLLKSLNEHLKFAIANKEKFSLTMLDIDLFKKINDTYGHQFGDICLNHLANILHNEIEDEGILGRYGGEEFIFTINNKDYDYVEEKNNHIREYIQDHMKNVEGNEINLTCSMGTVHVDISQIDDINVYNMSVVRNKVDSIIKAADKNLYESKKNGRNCLTLTKYINPYNY